jgi:hypothetical protein
MRTVTTPRPRSSADMAALEDLHTDASDSSRERSATGTRESTSVERAALSRRVRR